MIKGDTINIISEFAVTSEYFLHVKIDKFGKITSSDPNIGPIPTVFDLKEKLTYFADCFLSSDWTKYEVLRIKAQKNAYQSFVIDLQKINYPEQDTVPTKWEFFFVNGDFDTCFGIGHLTAINKFYDVRIGQFFDQNSEKKELLNSLLEDCFIGFWEFDINTKIKTMSKGLEQMLGYSENELSKGDRVLWQKHIHPEDLPNLIQDLSQYFKVSGNMPFKKEFRIFSKTNQTIWALGFGKTIKWSSKGLPIKVLGCIIDVSDRKRQELWLKEHQHFLKELAFEQSHLLRARVANILGVLDLLGAEPKNDESKKLIGFIKDETKKLDQALKKSIKESVRKNQSLEPKLPL
jgi:PAS domain S-box-containing protein